MKHVPSHDPIGALPPDETWFALRPRDAIQIRDGRTFVAGAGGAARTRRPWPSTIAGALGAAIAAGSHRASAVEPRTVRGPVLARRDPRDSTWRPVFPAPSDVVPVDGSSRRWTRLRPWSAAPAYTDADLEGLQWMHADRAGTRTPEAWWNIRDMETYLSDGMPDVARSQDMAPLVFEPRTGIAVRDRSARHSHLYSSDFLRLEESERREWAFLALTELDPGTPAAAGSVPLGGEGRLADVELCTVNEELRLPRKPDRFRDGKVLVYLATPGIWRYRKCGENWRNSWLPPIPRNATLVAAAVDKPEHVASAGPNSRGQVDYAWLRWAVPAGSIYLLRFEGNDPEGEAAAWAERRHGRAWGEDDLDSGGRRLATAGFGMILTGTWT